MSSTPKKQGEKKHDTLSAESLKKEPKPIQLEDEDEFEEFPRCEVQEKKSGLDVEQELNVWTDNWDDENIEKDFHSMLKEELTRSGHNI
ncbi:unnamed protein product [Bursaphelenchus okinawaensis]|uniref:26S proteasome complex subunit dss-1 n=1 Tax=Bursaphelenchus okinawaensis TaxID=465554 RepID=A0A811JTW7_9BILA|nr:unnamed protein product [Bursaphelenchus okinawaensis]CAG9083240.1 unnamed protein product [Bursaphelenchus okinawaensis]